MQTFHADALMNTMPWDYWQKDGSPKTETAAVISTLEAVMPRILTTPARITTTFM